MDFNEMNIMNEKFKFMNFLDCARWSSERNYSAINMADKKAPGEQVLLTHFLGYITNRQTPFEMIFERLDYIFSQLVQDYVAGMSVDDLLSPNKPETSFFVKRPAKSKKSQNEDADRYAFISHAQNYEDRQLPEITKGLQRDNDVFYASSRFYPTDYVAIRMTLDVLDRMFDRDYYSFIEWAINRDKNGKSLECLLYVLWVLGYRGVGQWTIVGTKSEKEKVLNFKELSSGDTLEQEKRSCYYDLLKEKIQVLDDFAKNGLNSDIYIKEFEFARENKKSKENKKSNRFKAKRAICYLRDLLKYKQCSSIFCEKIGEDAFKRLEDQIPNFLELPGDVWNNNGVFQNCLHNSKRKTGKPNYLIRKVYDELYDKLGEVGCCPEQFDCTFNFVPRMCDVSGRANCLFCPLDSKNIEKNSNHVKIPEEFCHHDESKFCPFLLFAVGYKVKCEKMKNCCPNWLDKK